MPSSAEGFLGLLGAALAAAALAGLLIWRARKPAAPPAQAAGTDAAPSWSARALAALRYVTTAREWRYRAPWVLMLGPRGGGKTSVALSLGGGARQGALLRERGLAIEDTDWHFRDGGVVIDPDGACSAAEPGSAGERRWRAILGELDQRRPERPLDAVMLVVPAPALLAGRSRDLAVACYRQLWTLQKRFKFVLPVYVAVSQCDAVEGFAAYWGAQDPERRREMIGWSNPALFGGAAPDWAQAAGAALAQGLRELQVNAAAGARAIEDADRFFLFPQHMGGLRAPLEAFLDALARPNAYDEGFLLRGIYFSGSAQAGGALSGKPRGDVAFVDDVFERRVFVERWLARPTRRGVFSRNRLLRRLQVAGVTLFAAACVALGAATLRLQNDVASLVASLRSLHAGLHESDCEDRQGVYALVAAISGIRAEMTYPAIPLSRFDSGPATHAGQAIARRSFAQVILPGIRCRLEQRAQALAADGGELLPWLAQAGAFELNLARFQRFVSPHGRRDEEPKAAFAALLEYAYGAPAPREIQDERGALGRALAHARYPRPPGEPPGLHEEAAGRIARGVQEQRQALFARVRRGGEDLRALERGAGPVPELARRLNGWVEWVGAEWLRSTDKANPCARLEATLREALAPLPREKYGRFDAALAALGPEQCYRPARRLLVEMQVVPFGAVFRERGGALELALAEDLRGLPALAGLPYMQRAGTTRFACRAGAGGWRTQSIADAQGFVRGYQEFARAQGVDGAAAALGRRPFYDRVARGGLHAVLEEALDGAQTADDASRRAPGDQAFAQASAEFGATAAPLLQLFGAMQQLGFADSHAAAVQCVRDFSGGMLARAAALGEASRLYEPPPGEERFFALGGEPAARDYLGRQLGRADVLARYAGPFAAFLKNTQPVNDAARDASQRGAFWDNTATEVLRYVQFKEPAGQVALLEGFFVKQLAPLGEENCGKLLGAYEPAGHGVDLFSERRLSLEKQARELCTDREQASAYALYRDVARRFNRDLAQRYPFGGADAPDASPAAVRDFFVDYEGRRAALAKAVSALEGELGERVKRFLAELDAAAALFRASLAAPGGVEPLKLEVGFRELPKQSPGSEQVIEWALRAGDRVVRQSAGQAAGLDYAFGAPLALDLVWAEQSRLRPGDDAAQRDLRARGSTATFAANGDWGLLRLIEAHRPRNVPVSDPLFPNRARLEFVVPVHHAAGPSGSARLYLALGIPRDPKAQPPAAFPPRFPQRAPVTW